MSEATTLTETEVSKNVSGPVITTEQKSVEVLDGNGKTISGTGSPLSDIFDKVASGEDVGSAVKSVMAQKPAKAAPEPVKDPVTEEKVETTPEVVIDKTAQDEAPKKVETTEAKADEITDEDLQVRPYDKPKTASRIQALLKKVEAANELAENTKKEAAEKAARLAELEKKLNEVQSVDPMTNEKVKSHLEELGMYRRRYELENSQEIKEKFDSRVTSAEDAIHKSLLSHRAPESIINIIKEEGGWLKFIDSQRTVSLTNGDQITAAELAEKIKAAIPPASRRQIDALELEQIQVSRDKQHYFNEESKKAKDYFAQQEAKSREAQEQQKKQMEEASKIVSDWRNKFREENEWLKEKELSPTLTKEQRAALEEHNNHAKQLNSLIDKHLSASKLDDMLGVLVDAVKFHEERRKYSQALAENAKLKEELKSRDEQISKFRKGGSAVTKTGSLNASIAAEAAAPSKPKSLEEALDAIAEGKSTES